MRDADARLSILIQSNHRELNFPIWTKRYLETTIRNARAASIAHPLQKTLRQGSRIKKFLRSEAYRESSYFTTVFITYIFHILRFNFIYLKKKFRTSPHETDTNSKFHVNLLSCRILAFTIHRGDVAKKNIFSPSETPIYRIRVMVRMIHKWNFWIW